MTFLEWWRKLNVALACRGEPEALHGEAYRWFTSVPNMRNLEPSEDRVINRIINERKPT